MHPHMPHTAVCCQKSCADLLHGDISGPPGEVKVLLERIACPGAAWLQVLQSQKIKMSTQVGAPLERAGTGHCWREVPKSKLKQTHLTIDKEQVNFQLSREKYKDAS